MVASVTSRRGKKDSVCSLICVAACTRLTMTPTIRLGSTSSTTSTITTCRLSLTRSTAISGVSISRPVSR
ncbi:hypothetical protein D3C85_1530440 [compost metagenome]